MKTIHSKKLFNKGNQKGVFCLYYELVIAFTAFTTMFSEIVFGRFVRDEAYLSFSLYHLILMFILVTGFLFRKLLSSWVKELILIFVTLSTTATLVFQPGEELIIAESPGWYLVIELLSLVNLLIISSGGIVKLYHSTLRNRQINPLTELGNEKWMNLYVNKRLKEGTRNGLLLLVNVKNFRMINAVYGRNFGDMLIISLAEYLKKSTESQSHIQLGHLSGIEFCLWVDNPDIAKVAPAFRELSEHFRFLVKNTGKAVSPVLLTAGATYPDNGMNFQQLHARANMVMEKIMQRGDTVPSFYAGNIEEELRRENTYDFELRKAVDNGSIYMNYQAKFDLTGSVLYGFEALARWNSPVLGRVSPEVFIPIVHNLGLTIPFTEMVVKKVFEDLESISRKYGERVHISLNIPPLYIQHPRAYSFLKAMLREFGVDPSRIILEITEDLSIEGREAVRHLEQLKSLGVKISLDDFGTGFSSLSYLLSLPIHELKIDKSFIDTIQESDRSYQLVKSICDIARINDCTIVAEGVETAEQVELLKGTSCNLIQGYVYGKPCDILEGKGLLDVDEVG